MRCHRMKLSSLELRHLRKQLLTVSPPPLAIQLPLFQLLHCSRHKSLPVFLVQYAATLHSRPSSAIRHDGWSKHSHYTDKVGRLSGGLAADIQVRIMFLSDSATDQPHTPFIYRSPPRCDYSPPLNATQVASSFHSPASRIQLPRQPTTRVYMLTSLIQCFSIL